MTAALANPDVRKRFAAAHANPADFARLFLSLTPTGQQRQLFDAVAGRGAKVAIRSGHGTGKSTALAVIALWYLCTRKDAKVPCTAPTAHQLQDVLWSEIRRLHARMPEWMRSQIRIAGDKVLRDGSAGFIVARTARPENPDALQGFHAENILFILDEAAGIHDSVFEVARGALSTPDARVVMTGNPTQLTGYFHNAFHLARDSWTRLHFSCLDSPLVASNYAKEIADEYGEDSDMYRIRVLGEFPLQGALAIIPADRVHAALERRLPLGAVDYAPAILGVDPAWMGSDRSAVAMRKGIFAKVAFVGRQVDGVRLANIVARLQDEHQAVATFIDQTGVGASVCDQLGAIGRRFSPVAFGGAALDSGRFVNRRAEMWWEMREWFERDVGVEHHQDLAEDLFGPEYGVNKGGKIYLESKDDMRKRGLHSPDLGDALALTFAAPVRPRAGAPTKNTFSGNFDPYGALKRKGK